MKILIANDHAGLDLKKQLLEHLASKKILFEDLGCNVESSVDYPDYANALILRMKESDENIGILICGSGIGMSIAANRNKYVRAALCHNIEYAKLARAHNDANVLVLGARFLPPKEAIKILDAFLSTPFEVGRHQFRVNKLS
jgi:ribose 5-phosphate isomerase B